MGYRYIGSKARIVEEIIKYLGEPESPDSRFIDAFSGTGVVASRAADIGWKISINDMMYNAVVMSESRILSKQEVPFENLGGYENAIKELKVASREGFIWKEYSPASLKQIGIERKYFSEENARRIDGAAGLIHEWKNGEIITKKEFVLLLATLISAVNNVANIAGTYGCFLSKWTQQAKKSINIERLELRECQVDYSVSTLDVFDVESRPCDVVYLDPPYTKRQYASYYHILETLVKGDKPLVDGVAGLRPWKENASVFCYKTKALKALLSLVNSQNSNRVLVSYSNEGHINLDEFESELQKTGHVKIIEMGAIGKYRPNHIASSKGADVKEYLIEYRKNLGEQQ